MKMDHALAEEWLTWGFRGVLGLAAMLVAFYASQMNGSILGLQDELKQFSRHLIEIDKRLEAVEVSRSINMERWQKDLLAHDEDRRMLFNIENRVSILEDRDRTFHKR